MISEKKSFRVIKAEGTTLDGESWCLLWELRINSDANKNSEIRTNSHQSMIDIDEFTQKNDIGKYRLLEITCEGK